MAFPGYSTPINPLSDSVITVSYDNSIEGFPSFYSYDPEFMIGVNNYFYSFKNAQLYRHNTNSARNTFYQNAVEPTRIISVLNARPLVNKVYKTLELESTDSWSLKSDASFTDLPQKSAITNTWFEKKEGNYFAFLRYVDNDIDFSMRSVNGIGNVTTVAGSGAAVTLTFTAPVTLGNIVSVGDIVYYGPTPSLGGEITAIGTNVITIDTTITGGSVPSNGDFICFVKNTVAESHGLLGHYLQYTLENTNTEKVEMFAVLGQVMQSYP